MSRYGNRLTPLRAQIQFSDVRRRAGVKRRVALHCFRRTWATWLVEEGVDLRTVEEMGLAELGDVGGLCGCFR